MVYVHIPFCRSFCTYCGFYSEIGCPGKEFVDALCAEAISRRDEIAASAAIDTLYFGGGTPSVLPLADIGRIADACGGRRWNEWTVEVNPDDVSLEFAAGLRGLGVNRVSMGVQSLDDGILRWMARRHDAAGARSAFSALRSAGFDNISVDIIYGIEGMSLETLGATVREILAWRPEHISAYQLSVDDGSTLGRLCRESKYRELDDESCLAQYSYICSALAAAGYEHYEISNWALQGYRAVHNSAYWARVPYVGLGPGAHSLHAVNAPTIPLHPQGTGGVPPETPCVATLRNVSSNESDANYRSWNSEELIGWTSRGEVLTEREIWEEKVMLGLRTADGIPEALLSGRPQPFLVPSAVPGNLRIPEGRWFTADDIISSII